MDLIGFYKKVLHNLRLKTDEDGYIYPGNSDVPLTVDDGKALVLPTKEQINTIYDTDDNGNPVAVKSLFNPLNEDVIKGDSIAITRMKRIIEIDLSYRLVTIGDLLFRLFATPSLQKRTTTTIDKFLSGVGELNISTGLRKEEKKIVDEKVFENWVKLYTTTQKTKDRFITIFLKKRGKYNGKVYNRLAVLHSSIYEEFVNYEKGDDILGVKVRPKDVKLYKYLFEYALPEMTDDMTICFGSNDTNSPTFIALMSLYIKITERFNKILKDLKDIDQEKFDTCYVPGLLTLEQVEDVSDYARELATIPSDIDINRQTVIKYEIEEPSLQDKQPVKKQPQQPRSNDMRHQQPYPQQPVPVQAAQPEPQDDVEKLRQAIYGGGASGFPLQQPVVMGVPTYNQPVMPQPSPLATPPQATLPSPDKLVEMSKQYMYQQQRQMQFQQPIYQQQPQFQQPYPQQPMYQQPAYQQPMYQQQPQFQQPLWQQPQQFQQPMYGQPAVPRTTAPNFGQVQQPPQFDNQTQPNISNPSGYWRS